MCPLKPMLQESLSTLYTEELQTDENYQIEAFWTRYKKAASMFLTVAYVEKVFRETEGWDNVAAELAGLCTESKLGEQLFLGFCPDVIKCTVNKYMMTIADEALLTDTMRSQNLNFAYHTNCENIYT